MLILPHRSAAPESVVWHHWTAVVDGTPSRLEPPTALLKGWDYAAPTAFIASATVHTALILSSTGLPHTDEIGLAASVECQRTGQRFVSVASLTSAQADELTVSVIVPPGQLAGAVVLASHLITLHDRKPTTNRTAHLAGSRLLSSARQNVILEGSAARFPTEGASFSAIGRPDLPWTLITAFEDLSDSFMATVRLLVNTDHLVGQAALSPETGSRYSGPIREFIVRSLISRIAIEFSDHLADDFPENSVGDVVDSMCQLLLNRGIASAVALYKATPWEFESLLTEELQPLTGVIE